MNNNNKKYGEKTEEQKIKEANTEPVGKSNFTEEIGKHFETILEENTYISIKKVELKKLIDNYNEISDENNKLKKFIQSTIQEICWEIEIDGGTLQELAEELGLIEVCTVTEEDVDDYSDFEVGDTIFKLTF